MSSFPGYLVEVFFCFCLCLLVQVPEFYNLRERSEDELFPWDFIDIGVSRKFLRREWERAMKETVTPNCRMQCSGCGAAKFGGGVCYESKN